MIQLMIQILLEENHPRIKHTWITRSQQYRYMHYNPDPHALFDEMADYFRLEIKRHKLRTEESSTFFYTWDSSCVEHTFIL